MKLSVTRTEELFSQDRETTCKEYFHDSTQSSYAKANSCTTRYTSTATRSMKGQTSRWVCPEAQAKDSVTASSGRFAESNPDVPTLC